MRKALIPLDERLFERPYEFDFFQAVRLLHLILNDRPGVGRIAKCEDEPVRFKVRQSLEFQASAIHAMSADADPPEMAVAFFGLTGVQGVMPHHYTEHILARAQARDGAMSAFFDLFNHRLLSLFYRAWEKHRFPVRYQMAVVHQERDDFTQYLFDWIGMGMAQLQGRMAIRDQVLLRYAGVLGQFPRCAISLRATLRDYFGVPVEIEQFVGAWYRLKDRDRSDLQARDLNNQLGEGAIAGDAVWDPQASFRIRLGPLNLLRFLAFLPDSKAAAALRDLVRFYVGPILQFDVQLILKADEVPWSRLGDVSAAGPRVGWCAWLKTGEFKEDADDGVFAS